MAPYFLQYFAYDADGRTSEKKGPNYTSSPLGTPSWRQVFSATMDGTHAAVGAVYSHVNVNGLMHENFYDAHGRRRLKKYPNGATDEYFYSDTHLLEDRGHGYGGASGHLVLDEYVWLEGRPLALLKSRLGTTANPDDYTPDEAGRLTGSCGRAFGSIGEEMPCGVYFPVVDVLGKPVLLLNASGQVAGSADYEPFGHINRVTLLSETPHNYPTHYNKVLAHLKQGFNASTTAMQVRAHFSLVDTEACNGTLKDYAYFTNIWGTPLKKAGTTADARVGGLRKGQVWSDWVQVPSDGVMHVRFTSNGSDLPNGCDGTPNTSGNLFSGVVLAGYEYRRYEKTASPVWLPLRFPGQYHDRETDLFENWNRYYDASVGRYLGPEPLLVSPEYVLTAAHEGMSVPVYAYAHNNPIFHTDPDGRMVPAIAAAVAACMASGVCGAAAIAAGEALVAGAAVASAAVIGWFIAENAQAEEEIPSAQDSQTGTREKTEHGEQRAEEARAGDSHRQVGDANRVVEQGREFTDSETGNTVHVAGDRVVVINPQGQIVTQFRNPRANTQARIRNGRWVPK